MTYLARSVKAEPEIRAGLFADERGYVWRILPHDDIDLSPGAVCEVPTELTDLRWAFIPRFDPSIWADYTDWSLDA